MAPSRFTTVAAAATGTSTSSVERTGVRSRGANDFTASANASSMASRGPRLLPAVPISDWLGGPEGDRLHGSNHVSGPQATDLDAGSEVHDQPPGGVEAGDGVRVVHDAPPIADMQREGHGRRPVLAEGGDSLPHAGVVVAPSQLFRHDDLAARELQQSVTDAALQATLIGGPAEVDGGGHGDDDADRRGERLRLGAHFQEWGRSSQGGEQRHRRPRSTSPVLLRDSTSGTSADAPAR